MPHVLVKIAPCLPSPPLPGPRRAGSELEGAAVEAVHQTGLVRVLAVQPPGAGPVNWSPAPDLRLGAQNRLFAIATRAGFSGVLARSLAPG
jgi:hypothetical protein